MGFDVSRMESIREEPKAELLSWKQRWTPGSPQYTAATVELARREELISFIRFWSGFIVAAVSLIVGTVALIRHWW